MKKLLMILLTLGMVMFVIGCSEEVEPVEQTPVTEETEGANEIEEVEVQEEVEEREEIDTREVTVEEQLLFEYYDIRLTVTSLDSNTIFGQELNVLIENNSDSPVIVQVRNVSINGLMIDAPLFSPETMPGMKNNDSIAFLSNELEANGIDVIGTIELSFALINPETWETFFDTELFTINTSAAGQVPQAEAPTQEMIEVYNQDGITISFVGFNADEFWGIEAMLFIENNSEQAIIVQAQNISVNGFMVNGLLSADVMPGRSTNTAILLFNEELEPNGIDEIETMNVTFRIVDPETFATVTESDIITIP